MNAPTEYFEFIKKLEKDPEFCFIVTNAGKELVAASVSNYDKGKRFHNQDQNFLEKCGFNAIALAGKAKKIREDFSIEANDHPTHKQCLQTISTDPKWSLLYAYFNALENEKEKRFTLGENAIAQCALYSYLYATKVINEKFELGEDAISKDAELSIDYARFNRTRFTLAEPLISTSGNFSAKYSQIIGRFEMGEPAISADPELSYWYAETILIGRFEMGEPAISTDENLMLKYARNIMKGKLPEDMHHIMIGKKLAA